MPFPAISRPYEFHLELAQGLQICEQTRVSSPLDRSVCGVAQDSTTRDRTTHSPHHNHGAEPCPADKGRGSSHDPALLLFLTVVWRGLERIGDSGGLHAGVPDRL